MNQNHWSEENYRNVLNDISDEHFWDTVLQDLKNPVSNILVNIALLHEDIHDNSSDAKEILETLHLLKTNSQLLLSMVLAVEAHLLDKQKSDSGSIT